MDDLTFGDRLAAAVARTGPICAGVDPSAALLGAWGLADDAGGLRAFAGACVEAFAGVVPVVKPQVAFFERHGAAGLAVLERLIADARSAGLLVIADAKRGDIDSTAAAYADAWLGPSSPLAADAVTAVAYLGLGALDPLFAAARATGRGVVVVVRSSNPEGRPLQQAVLQQPIEPAGAWPGPGAGQSVEDGLLAAIAEMNRAELAGRPGSTVGSVGAVVGATLAPSAFPLERLGGPVLAPGVGAQGGTVENVAALFGRCPAGTVVPNTSRSVLAAGPSVAALRQAAVAARDQLGAALGR
ncbi:MAG TPA: orotidine-5'-phosphate decarboxylase [Acidimicrobiales bacterium]|nr:orotidine-5'-phosphate decarboxylase [Acidimicrobiales bacterium]